MKRWLLSQTPQYQERLALVSILLMAPVMLLLTDRAIKDLLIGSVVPVWGFLLLNVVFAVSATVCGVAPRMDYRFRLVIFAVGVAVALPSAFAATYAIAEYYSGNCLFVSAPDFELGSQVYRYFSFTTFTTLGYGEVTPRGFCREITSIQSVTGMIYVGILIGILVDNNARKPI